MCATIKGAFVASRIHLRSRSPALPGSILPGRIWHPMEQAVDRAHVEAVSLYLQAHRRAQGHGHGAPTWRAQVSDLNLINRLSERLVATEFKAFPEQGKQASIHGGSDFWIEACSDEHNLTCSCYCRPFHQSLSPARSATPSLTRTSVAFRPAYGSGPTPRRRCR